jgi:chorismate mutase
LVELQRELLRRANGKVEYDDIADEINRLRELKQNALAESAQHEEMKQRITEMTEFLDEQTGVVDEYDEQLVRRLIEKVAVYDEQFVVEFKAGMIVDIVK